MRILKVEVQPTLFCVISCYDIVCLSDYDQAIELYSEALKLYPTSCEHEVAVCCANRAACHMKKVSLLLLVTIKIGHRSENPIWVHIKFYVWRCDKILYN